MSHRVVMVAALAMLCAGCASKTEVTKKPEPKTVVYQRLSPTELRMTLEKKLQVIKNFAVRQARVTVQSHLVPGSEQILTGPMAIEFPDKLKMLIGKPHTSVKFHLISDGTKFMIVNHAQKIIYTGPVHGPLSERAKNIRFKPSDICNVIFCRELTDHAGFERRMVFAEAVGNLYTIYVLNYDYPNKLYSKVWVDRHTLRVVGHQLYDPSEGEVLMDAAFGNYQENDPYDLPHEIIIRWPQQNTVMTLALQGIKVNQRWDDPNMFKCEYPTKGFEVVSLYPTDMGTGQAPYGLQERAPAGRTPTTAPPWQRAYPRHLEQKQR